MKHKLSFLLMKPYKMFSIGDSSAWQVNPVGTKLFIKPIAGPTRI